MPLIRVGSLLEELVARYSGFRETFENGLSVKVFGTVFFSCKKIAAIDWGLSLKSWEDVTFEIS